MSRFYMIGRTKAGNTFRWTTCVAPCLVYQVSVFSISGQRQFDDYGPEGRRESSMDVHIRFSMTSLASCAPGQTTLQGKANLWNTRLWVDDITGKAKVLVSLCYKECRRGPGSEEAEFRILRADCKIAAQQFNVNPTSNSTFSDLYISDLYTSPLTDYI